MGQYVDFIPVALFFVAFYATGQDIFIATGVLLVSATALLGWQRVHQGHLTRQQWILWGVLMGFGGLTLVLQDKTFIQWKPTIVYWLLALALLGGQFFGEQNLLQRMLGHQLRLPRHVWTHLNLGWSLGFAIAGALNLWVVYNFSEAVWVNFKLFGAFAISIGYAAISIGYLAWLGLLEEPPAEDAETDPVGER